MTMILEYVVAACIRYIIINSGYMQSISDRIEISTPLNSWKRILEGTYLYGKGVDPYEGDLFHETPLVLVWCSLLLKYVPQMLPFIFVITDLLTALTLTRTARLFMLELANRQDRCKNSYAKDALTLLINKEELKTIPIYVAAAYLFNPYTILSCVGMSTTVFANLFLALTFYGMIRGSRLLCCASMAMATMQSLYPVMLVLPTTLYLYQKSNLSCKKCEVLRTIIMFLVLVSCLMYTSKSIMGSWKFIESTYGFILNVPDLRPNIGLFWYFFTEMFEHFRPLFICAFQINATFLYLVPLTLRLRKEPMLLATSLTALTAIFKSYPSLGDVGFYLALLPMWKHLFNYMQQGFIVGCFFIVTSVLGPTVWHLWIYSRSANANFFFGVTLAFATAQIFLVTDILFAYIKREYSLHKGLLREIDGQPAKLVLE